MKKVLLSFLIVFLSLFFVGCESKEDIPININEESSKFSDFNISYDNVDVTPGVVFDYTDIKGKTPKISTISGCALYGYDHVYTYDNIEIVANINSEENIETVYSVYFKDDTVSTPEGIKIGSSVDSLLKAYGKEYDEFNGVYTFNGVGLFLQVQTKDDKVTSIEYIMVTN